MKAGDFVVDARDGRVGEVMGHEGVYVQLRPPGGGREWDCPPEALSPAPPGDVLRERVRRLNTVSRQETGQLTATGGAGERAGGSGTEPGETTSRSHRPTP